MSIHLRSRRFAALLLLPAAGLAWWAAQAPPAAAPMNWFPSQALLTLESADFAALVNQWNASPEKRAWLASDAYRQYAVSRFALRLTEAQQGFAAAASAPIDMTALSQLAGARTVFALYNIGEMEFLYVTELPEARFAQSLLARRRTGLSPRQAAGRDYFVATGSDPRRNLSFAAHNGYLLLATSERLLAEALTRMATPNTASGLAADDWYARAATLAGSPGDLRLTTNLDALARAPHFRSYWIQRNRAEFAPFLASVSDLDRTPARWSERRILLRKQPQSAAPSDAALWSTLLRGVPPTAGLYRAWQKPETEFAASLIARKLFQAATQEQLPPANAPGAPASYDSGSEGDWDTNIAEPPFTPPSQQPAAERLARWLAANPPTGLLHAEATTDDPAGLWITRKTGLMLTAANNWDAAQAQAALGAVPHRIEGNRIYVASTAEWLEAMRTGGALAAPAVASLSSHAGFRHGAERARFARWMKRIDQPHVHPPEPGQQNQPQFFADSVASLSQALAAVQEQTVSVFDLADHRRQLVVYQFATAP